MADDNLRISKPEEPPGWLQKTGREKKQTWRISGGVLLLLAIPMAIFALIFEPAGLGEADFLRNLQILCLVVILACLYSFYCYITIEPSDDKTPAMIKYEEEMEQYQLEKEAYEEDLKKDSPFYIGDGTTGSEMKNTCKRCNKIWYLDAEELKELEDRLETSTKLMGQMGGLGMVTALFNPMLSAQMGTMAGTSTTAFKMLADELNEKSRCPECNSKNIDRTLVDTDDKVSDKKVIIKRKKNGPSKMQELEKLSEMKKEGLIDIDEFKQMKKEILGK